MKKIALSLIFTQGILPVLAGGMLFAFSLQSQAQSSEGQVLFATHPNDSAPYRIPVLAQTQRGDILYFTDYRPCGSDIGYGRVDQHYRISKDGGLKWGPEQILIQGSGVKGARDCGFGDPALVADRTSKEVLLISGCGNAAYPLATTTRQNPMRMALFRSFNGGKKWQKWQEITEQIYTLFDHSSHGEAQSLFAASGKIMQSRSVRLHQYYRLYMAILVRGQGNFVLYSDDFGRQWQVLGGVEEQPCPKGDEAKCEELPDGSVLLSSRKGGGRFFNIFRFSDVEKAQGHWQTCSASQITNNGVIAKDNTTNGEILLVEAIRQSDGKKVPLLLQSLPLGPGRSHVGIYYKPLSTSEDYATPAVLAANWGSPYQVTALPSAYSTFIALHNGKIAMAWEEETFGKQYTEMFRLLTIEEITGGKYKNIAK
jgi:sialidase-1